MGTRTCAEFDPTPATIALNAFIFGYGGHSLVTPHTALKQKWWTDERIAAQLEDRQGNFIVSQLRGEERSFLRKPIGFGEDLTDDTYIDWIQERAGRLFLILCDIGAPDQIFGCIDDAWNDDDLPIALEDVHKLELAIDDDEALDRKFYDRQFIYLLRELQRGSHINYGPNEHIPMEHVNTTPPAVTLQVWDRIHFPGRPGDVYMRRKYPLTDKKCDKESRKERRKSFLRDVRKTQELQHEHIAAAWASYTTKDSGYVISDFVGEHTLESFIAHRGSASYQRLRESEKPFMLCQWMHCLADALASLRHRGTAHTAIRPTNILIDHDNRIAFADIGSLRTFQHGKKAKPSEAYEYAAPETRLAQAPLSLASSPPMSSTSAFSKIRQFSTSTSGSSSSSSNASTSRHNSWCTAPTTPGSPQPLFRCDSISTIASNIMPSPKSPTGFRNFSRHISHPSLTSVGHESTTSVPTTIIHLVPSIAETRNDTQEVPAQVSDIFSLGCNFLDIITFMIRGKTSDFVKFRSTRTSSPSKRKSRTDSSFHADTDRINAWIELLKEDSRKMPGAIYRCVPGLLDLVSAMLETRWAHRPTAMAVRNNIQDILITKGEIETLCCASREWCAMPTSKRKNDALDNFFRDDISIATGAPDEEDAAAEEGAEAAGDAQVVSVFEDDWGADMINRSQSRFSRFSDRRASMNSASTAVKHSRVSSWRRAFSRGSQTR